MRYEARPPDRLRPPQKCLFSAEFNPVDQICLRHAPIDARPHRARTGAHNKAGDVTVARIA